MILSRHGSVYCHLMLAYHYFLQVTENNENAKEKQKKYYKLKKSKGFKTYKFHVGQAVMKANPKKLGGRKGDRMTPDWLDGYVVVSLTEHQVVLRNTKTNKVLKCCSLTHIKPFVERAGGENFDVDAIGDVDANIGKVVDDKVAGGEDVGDKVAGGEVVIMTRLLVVKLLMTRLLVVKSLMMRLLVVLNLLVMRVLVMKF